jgi:hypothetical protein
MTEKSDKKKPPSMKVAAATQKLTKGELEALLKDAANVSSGEGDAVEEDELPPEQPAPKKPAKKK